MKWTPSAVKNETGKGRLGTFAGVFTPSVLTILGIILFLRLGYVVGNAGLSRALIILGLANLISVLTSISLAAIATNMRVKGGGDYYLISRTLGLEYGGAIGLVLFLAQSVSIGFYTIGLGEAVAGMLPPGMEWISPRSVALAAIAGLFVLAWLGADWATRFQYLVMALLVAALVSFGLGALSTWQSATLAANWPVPRPAMPFWPLFAVFFPAVTGFTQGVSMSGDLKDPGRSLPLGTFLAVGISILVYLATAILLAGVLPNARLAGDYSAMQQVASWRQLIDAGVVAATLSSAMASFLGAPRILQSLAADKVFGFLHPFARGTGPGNNPRRGVLLSGAIAIGIIALGNLNAVAAVVSMFFLISYGLLNYATYFEARTASPSFRPRLGWYHRGFSLAGFLACLGVMAAIDLKTAIVAVSVLFAVYQYLQRTTGPAHWADSQRSYHLQQVREHLLAAAADPGHPRDWRPQIVVFSKDPRRRARLLALAEWMEGGSGLTTLVEFVADPGQHHRQQRGNFQRRMKTDITRSSSTAFALPVVTMDVENSLATVIQTAGTGPLRVNTILFNWLDPEAPSVSSTKEYILGRNLRTAIDLGCNIAILATDEDKWQQTLDWPTDSRFIDAFWRDDPAGRLVLLLAYLITRASPWQDAVLRLRPTSDEGWTSEERERLEQVLHEARIDAIPVESTPGSRSADDVPPGALALVPFELHRDRLKVLDGRRVESWLDQLPTTILVLSPEDIVLDADPEEGEAVRVAAAAEALEAAHKNLRQADQNVAKARDALDDIQARIAVRPSSPEAGARPESVAPLREALEVSRREFRKAVRRAERAALRVQTTARQAEAMGIESKTAGAGNTNGD